MGHGQAGRARVGIQDVARAAGVSTTTVSHALNGRGKVSATTRLLVERVAGDLGYEPNRVATALRRRRSDVLGFVSDEIATTPFAGRIVLGAQEAAAARGMTLMVVNSERRPEVERRQVQALRSQQVDGLLYAAMFHRAVAVPPEAGPLPVALVNATSDDPSFSSIAPDERGVGEDAARHLLQAGHRRIVHLTIDEPTLAREGRVAGFRGAMEAAGATPLVVSTAGPADAAAGRAAMREALHRVPDATAVFAFNDLMAMGVYQVAAEVGRSIPTELSVVGVDNLEIIAAQVLPGLTTFELPHYEMGRWGVDRVARLLEDAAGPPEVVRVRCRLIPRNSVALRA